MLTGFSNAKIVSLLEIHSLWGKRACREILRRKEDFIPLLIGFLDEMINDLDPYMYDGKESNIPAALLLAQMRVPEAYPRLVSLVSYDEETIDLLWGDMLFEFYPRILRDTFNGEAFLLPRLMENRSVSPWSRAMAVQAWGMHYFDGYVSREEITGCFRRLIHEVYTGKPDSDDITVLTNIAVCIKEQQLDELLEDVKSVYSRKGVDTDMYGDSNEYIEEFNNPEHRAKDSHIDDTIRELEKWGWFQERKSSEGEEDTDYYDDGEDSGIKTKIGRNEPCPCGSGKKYKNCCLGIM